MKKLSLFLAVLMVCLCAFTGCAKTDGGVNSPVKVDSLGEDLLRNEDALSSNENPVTPIKDFLEKFDFNNFDLGLDLELVAHEGFGDFLTEVSGQPEIAEIFDQIGLDSVSLDFDFAHDNGLVDFTVDALVNDLSIVDASVIYDTASLMGYLDIPDLTDRAAALNLSEMVEEIDLGFDFKELFNVYVDYLVSLEEFYAKYDDEAVFSLLGSYVDTAKSSLGDSVDNGTQEFNFGNFTATVDTQTYLIGEKDALNVAIALLEKLKEDELAREFVVGFLDIVYTYVNDMYDVMNIDEEIESLNFEEVYDEFIAEIDSTLDELKQNAAEISESDDDKLSLDILSSNGSIVGFVLSNDFDEDPVNLTVAAAEKDGLISAFVSFSDSWDEMLVSFLGESKDGVVNGILTVADNYGMSFEIAVEDFVINEDGTGKGAIAIYGDSLYALSDGEIPGNIGFRFIIDQPDLYTSKLSIELLNYSEAVATLNISSNLEEGSADISVPSAFVDAESDEIGDWTMEILENLPGLFDKLVEAGINADIIDMIMSQL